ncbi:Uncharacterized protein YrrD, contains PRC-barrel domain [Caldanaerobius fijiensis DSM 17918]|uniref:Uncharacterized protein YrrD, contains PRC-barrel domain n=1 Tax=Caldanaerobius fijiensis DSM 17918 TaxID=1121256 RepID=A0A1M4U0U2_9THEO|nr:PRC-barrel domain-containing protein [Caldanaerobius fijiensis]SHE50348.1 Uncharacterized protein YrrD, contains PRC-barrel domain [Caldanaerobius fijiensis DSM 17918]
MIKASSLLNLPVYSDKTGKKLGNVKDVVYGPLKDSIVGYIINSGSIFKSPKFVMANNISHITKDYLVVKDEYSIQDLSENSDIFIHRNSHFVGSSVKDTQGKNLGIVSDAVVDTGNNQVKGYILSDGLISDLINGRSFIERNEDIIYDGHDIIVTRR